MLKISFITKWPSTIWQDHNDTVNSEWNNNLKKWSFVTCKNKLKKKLKKVRKKVVGEWLFTWVNRDRTRGNGFKLTQKIFGWILGGSFSPRGWWCTGTDCPERLWMPHSWRHSRQGWLCLWTAWWQRCPWQGGWN